MRKFCRQRNNNSVNNRTKNGPTRYFTSRNNYAHGRNNYLYRRNNYQYSGYNKTMPYRHQNAPNQKMNSMQNVEIEENNTESFSFSSSVY